MWIDLNCDMGESFGAYSIGADAELMPLITSANIACGYHGGDPVVMDRTVALAARHSVAVGAHPGYPDLAGFGRRAMAMSAAEIEAAVLYQVAALAGFCRGHGVPLAHVKAHGALYNTAAADPAVAEAIAAGVARFDRGVALMGLASSQIMAAAAAAAGLRFVAEAFADRAYNPDGTLQARRYSGSLITDPNRAAAQAVAIAQGYVVAHDGTRVAIHAETVCLHGDNPAARANAAAVREALARAGVEVRAIGDIYSEG